MYKNIWKIERIFQKEQVSISEYREILFMKLQQDKKQLQPSVAEIKDCKSIEEVSSKFYIALHITPQDQLDIQYSILAENTTNQKQDAVIDKYKLQEYLDEYKNMRSTIVKLTLSKQFLDSGQENTTYVKSDNPKMSGRSMLLEFDLLLKALPTTLQNQMTAWRQSNMDKNFNDFITQLEANQQILPVTNKSETTGTNTDADNSNTKTSSTGLLANADDTENEQTKHNDQYLNQEEDNEQEETYDEDEYQENYDGDWNSDDDGTDDWTEEQYADYQAQCLEELELQEDDVSLGMVQSQLYSRFTYDRKYDTSN